jgi:hypothetical protein
VADPLLGRQGMTGELDADAGSWFARAWLPGPAGTAPLQLAGGIEVDFDVAAPGVVAGLSVPAELTPRARGALDLLLGEDRAAALVALHEPGHVHQLGPDATYGRDGGLADRRLVRAALARLTADLDATDGFIRGLGLLEAAVSAARIGPGLGLRRRARAAASEGIELLVDAPEPRDGQEIAALVRAGLRLLPDESPLAGPAGRMARDLETRRPPIAADAMRSAMPAAAPMMAESAAGGMAKVARFRARPVEPRLDDSLPPGVDSDGVWLDREVASEVVVTVAGYQGDAGLWARAIDDDVVVALAPFRGHGSAATSRLLVPPLSQSLTIELTVDAASPVISRQARATRAALRLGRSAARADRLGKRSYPHAEERWRRCSAAWEAAGDPSRAGQAANRSDRGSLQPASAQATTADVLVERAAVGR